MLNKDNDIIIAKRNRPNIFIVNIIKGIFSLLKGMNQTIRYFFKSVFVSTVTMEYPEKKHKIKISNRFRAKLVLHSDTLSSPHKCTGCRVCEKACPNKSIYIISKKGLSQKIELQNFIWRLDSCTFCNACVISCPFDALAFKNHFEQAVYDRRLLIYNLNRYMGPPKSYIEKNKHLKNLHLLMQPIKPYEKISLQEILGRC